MGIRHEDTIFIMLFLDVGIKKYTFNLFLQKFNNCRFSMDCILSIVCDPLNTVNELPCLEIFIWAEDLVLF